MSNSAGAWTSILGITRTYVVTALACLIPWATHAAEPVKVGCVEFPPLSYTDNAGKPAGTALELIATILNQAGLPWEAKCYPGARLMASLRDGSVHVAMLIRHPDVVESVLYGHLPMAFLELDGYRLATQPPLGAMENVRGKSVILLRGYGYGGWIDFFKDPANGVRINYADSHQAAFKMLTNGHGEYLVDYRDPATLALGETTIPKLQRELLTRLETYFLVSKKAPDAAKLLWRIEDGFKQLGARPID
ncbi:MAG: transporter substrate-binding domain-containing protein [Magnetospirillum sp.]|nr:transporter substrate-binding domain-containing protein [Magnetospirillum sp.]